MRKALALVLLPAIGLAIYDMKWFDLNNWRCPFYNYGPWGIDNTGLPRAGGSWPSPLRNFYIFGAGPWAGTVAGNETLVTIGYNPNTAASEMVPVLCRYYHQGTGDSLDRIYKYPGDWPAPLNRFPMAPQEPRSEMDLWMCFSDSEPDYHTPPGRPLGIDLYLTVYGFTDSFSRDMFILKYELANASGAALSQIYFGIAMDADVGSCTDDMAGLILNRRFAVGSDTFWVKNVAFFYDFDNSEMPGENWESGTPGAVAIRLLLAPNNRDLTAFKRFTIEFDPATDPEQYLTLKGYDYRNGDYVPYDSLDSVPGDKRGLLAVGPVDLAPAEVATYYFAVIAAPYGTQGQMPWERDTTELALRCWWAEQVLARILGIEEERQPAQVNRELKVYPNPCVLGSHLRVAFDGMVDIYDTQGRLVRVLNGKEGVWDTRDVNGRVVPAGVYFVQPAGAKGGRQKVLLVRGR